MRDLHANHIRSTPGSGVPKVSVSNTKKQQKAGVF
jgi:hypothetical protein